MKNFNTGYWNAMLAVCIGILCQSAWASPAGEIHGRITLGKGLKIPAGAVIFISARMADAGPPVAVKRIADAKLPLEFSLTKEDSMMGGELSGEVEVTVRASQTGDAMGRSPGDLYGKAKAKAGGKDVVIPLDHKI